MQIMADNITYSFNKPAQLNAIQALLKQTEWAHNRTQHTLQVMIENTPLYLGAWTDDRMIGFARILTDDVFRAFIEDVIVDVEYRKRGIGREMIRRILARLSHVQEITLHCSEENMPFYEALGFKPHTSHSMHIWKG
jgi:ribosomal protein S18 acetylase RimI-like enzyme